MADKFDLRDWLVEALMANKKRGQLWKSVNTSGETIKVNWRHRATFSIPGSMMLDGLLRS